MADEESPLLGGCGEYQIAPSSGKEKVQADRPTGNKKFPLHVKVTFICMALTDVLAGCYFAMVAPFFPILASDQDISSLQIGVVFSCFELVFLIATPIWGKLIVKTGPRFMYLAGVFVCSACSVLFGALEYCPPGPTFLVMSILTRTFEGAAAAALSTASYTVICILFPDNSGMATGILEMSQSLGFTLGPLIGGVLYQAVGYMMTFVIAACPLVIVGLVGVAFMRVDHVSGSTRPSSSLLKFISSPLVIVLIAQTVILGGMVYGFLDSTLALQLQQFNLTSVDIGAIFLAAAAGYSIFSPLFGHLGDKYPSISLPLLAGGGICAGVTFMFLGPAPFFFFLPSGAIWLIVVSLIILGTSAAVVSTTFSQLVLAARKNGFPDDLATHGMVASAFGAFINCGAFLGPVLGGSLYDTVGFEWGASTFGFICILSSLALIIYICWTRKSDTKSDSAECYNIKHKVNGKAVISNGTLSC